MRLLTAHFTESHSEETKSASNLAIDSCLQIEQASIQAVQQATLACCSGENINCGASWIFAFANAEAVRAAFRIPKELSETAQFSECLPQPFAAEIVKDRLLEPARLEALLRKRCKFVVMPSSSSPGTDQE